MATQHPAVPDPGEVEREGLARRLDRAARWLMGDLDVSSYQPIMGALPMLVGAYASVQRQSGR